MKCYRATHEKNREGGNVVMMYIVITNLAMNFESSTHIFFQLGSHCV